MQKEIENVEFVHGVNFEFIDSIKKTAVKYLSIFDDSCKRFAIQKPWLLLLPQEDIVDWVLFTLSTTCFIKVN